MSDSNRSAVRYALEPYFGAPIGGSYATNTVVFAGIPANNDTITVNGVVYTAKTTIASARDYARGSSAAVAAQNFADAINHNLQTEGVAWYPTTPADTYVIASVVGTTVTLTARLHGTGPNAYTLAESGVNTSVGSGTFSGGTASDYANVTALRFNSHSLKHGKMTVESEEIRSDRTAFGTVKVGISAGGDINHELHYGDLTPFIGSAMMADVVSGSSTATDWSITSNVLAKGAATPAGVLGARLIKIAGFATAANNGIKRVTVSGNNITILGDTLADEAAGASVTITWLYYRQGVTLTSYLLETEDTGSGIVVPLTGMCVNEWALTFGARAKIMTRFGFLGKGLPSGSVTRTDTCGNAVTAPSLNPIYNTTSHVAKLYQNGLPQRAPATSVDFLLNNNLRERPAIGIESTLVPGTGEASFTGTLRSYFDSKFEYDDFLNHLDASLEFQLVDSSSQYINIYMPAVQFGDGANDVPGTNQDVFMNRTFKAKKGVGHDGNQFQCQVDMLAA